MQEGSKSNDPSTKNTKQQRKSSTEKTIRCKRLPKAAIPAPSHPLLSPSEQQPTNQKKIQKLKFEQQTTKAKSNNKQQKRNKKTNNENEIKQQTTKME